jgi:hypothetical protein
VGAPSFAHLAKGGFAGIVLFKAGRAGALLTTAALSPLRSKPIGYDGGWIWSRTNAARENASMRQQLNTVHPGGADYVEFNA